MFASGYGDQIRSMFAILAIVGIGLCMENSCSPAVAQSFRVKTQLFTGDETSPVLETLTIADGGYIYDFSFAPNNLDQAREIVMLDLRRQQFVLMDIPRKVKVQVDQTEISKMLEDLRGQLAADPELKNLVDKFQPEVADLAAGTVKLESDRLRYTATCEKPKNSDLLPIYFDYLDHFARLNVTDPTRMAPFARLQLNTAIKAYGWVPTKIELEIKRPGRFKKNQVLTSTHEIVWAVSKDDLRRLDEAKLQLTAFQTVSLPQYRQWKSQTAPTAETVTAPLGPKRGPE